MAAACVLSSSLAFAQAVSGDITGAVLDTTGAAIPNAKVVASSDATGVQTTAETNSIGVYRFSNLEIGKYTLSGSASGFATARLQNVDVTLNQVSTANLTLPLATSSTTVEVTSSAVSIDTTTAQLQATFDSKEVLDLPATGNNAGAGVYNLALLGAGVSSSGGIGQGFGPAVAGQRPDNNSFNLDGVSNNNYVNPAPMMTVSNEAIGEFTLLQNQFAPEFGGGSGGIFNAVVKSGTNELHGSIYDYTQNRILNAVNSQYAVQGVTTNPRYDNNRLGATIGGPILRNKFFYFGNFEYNPVGQSAVPGAPLYAPTAQGYSMLAGMPGLSQTNLQQFQKYIPAAPQNDQGFITVNNTQIPIGSVSFVTPTYSNTYAAIVSLDYDLSNRDQFRGRWIYNKNSSIAPGFEPVFNVVAPNNNYMYTLSEFHNFSPTLQNEFRIAFNRGVNAIPLAPLKFPGLDAFPQITIDELGSLTFGPTNPSGATQNQFQAVDNLSKVFGNHTLKVGGNFIDVISTNYFIQRVTGNYEYSSLDLYLTDQAPDVLGERSAGATSDPVGFLQTAVYASDDWRVRPNLTLNLGLRYEYVTMPIASRYQIYSAPANVPGGITFGRPYFNPTDFGPHFGFAYSPGSQGNWSIRGGFSQAYDLSYANLTANAAPPYFQQTNDCPGPQCPATGFLAGGGLPGTAVPLPTNPAAALGAVSSYTFGGKRPYALTWNFGVQHSFWKNYIFEARYVGNKGVHLWNQSRLNIYPLVSPTNYLPTFVNMPSLSTLASLNKTLGGVSSYIVPGGTADQPNNSLAALGSDANIVAYAPQSMSFYNGLALQLNRRYSNGLAFIAAYTWSHAEDDATATNFSTYLSPRRAQNYQDLAAEWASSALDHRQRLTITPIYDFKPFKNGSWFMKNLLGNWNVSATYTYESPELSTVQSGIDSNLNGDSAGDRTIINRAGAANMGTGVTAYNAMGQAVPFDSCDPLVETLSAACSGIVAYVANNPNARYIEAGYGALANAGRNTFPLNPVNNVDLGLKKRLTFKERYNFDIGVQAYNLFNHPQWTGGSVNDVSVQSFTGARNELQPQSNSFGQFNQFYSSNSRTVQLVAHITF